METLQPMQAFFDTGATRPIAFRRQQLINLRKALQVNEALIHAALFTDLRKNLEEAYITETGFVLAEISYALKHLNEWMEPARTATNLLNFPSKSYVLREPLGIVLIIGPWNYPLQLVLSPLVGALAAGNCAVLKPSEHAPATSAVLITVIRECFDQNYVQIFPGDGSEVVPTLIKSFHFCHIFYTGSTTVGREIYKMAAEQLIPVTLELGGKSPCVVLEDANLRIAAKRIVLAKFSNAGQMCVAPDYILVQHSVKDKLVAEMKRCIRSFFGEQAITSYNLGRIINKKQFNRIVHYLTDGVVLYGGGYHEA